MILRSSQNALVTIGIYIAPVIRVMGRALSVDLQIVVTYFFRFIFTCSFIDYHIIIFILKMFSPCFSRFAPPYFLIKTPFPDRVLPGKVFLEILFANAFDCTG